MPLPLVWLDGKLLPLEEARISPLDRGFLFGDGAYEVLPIYELNCRLATLEPLSAQQLGLRAALRGNREATEQFFGVNAGTVPYHQFFAPDNIARIMSQAAVTTG